MGSKVIIESLLEWHRRATLEACKTGMKFLFFRNKEFIGEISLDPGRNRVKRSLQGTGIGHAMIQFMFDSTPGMPTLTLEADAPAFYHRIGGTRIRGTRRMFLLDRRKIKPSKWRFQPISREIADEYMKNHVRLHGNKEIDSWPARNAGPDRLTTLKNRK